MRDEWNLGIIAQPISDIVRNGITAPVQWFPPNPWRIFADPFCIVNLDGSVTILAEKLNHWVGRGEIWQATVPAGSNPLAATFHPMMRVPSHLSYPFVVHENEMFYMLVESHEANALHLWGLASDTAGSTESSGQTSSATTSSQSRPDGQWHYLKTILSRPAVDATLWRGPTHWWLFCTFSDDGPDDKLHLFYADSLLGNWTPHRDNPVKTNRGNARPGGALFWANGKLIRPAQNSMVTYGGSLVLNEVTAISRYEYAERPYRELMPIKPYRDGIHTIAGAGGYTVIDGKRWHHGVGTAFCRMSAKLDKIHRARSATCLQKWQPPHSFLPGAKQSPL